MSASKVALRLQASILREAKRYFLERASRADLDKAKRILKRAGRGKAPVAGDEI
jgi:hypothetical protein